MLRGGAQGRDIKMHVHSLALQADVGIIREGKL
jgi:hypothetical protein